MVQNHGAGLLEDPPTRASPEPQVRPLAPRFTVRSPGRDMSPDIRPMCLDVPDFRSGSLIDDALESRRALRAHPSGTATTHFLVVSPRGATTAYALALLCSSFVRLHPPDSTVGFSHMGLSRDH